MKVLVIVCHHREDSVTQQVRKEFEKGLRESGHEYTTLDLFKIGFNPLFTQTEEPYRSKPFDEQTEEVQREIKRVREHDAIAAIFPMYWFDMPAMMKGYIDRIFVHGVMYGSSSNHGIKKMLWMTVTGASRQYYKSSSAGSSIENIWNECIAGYCGINKSKVEYIGNINEGSSTTTAAVKKGLKDAYQEGLKFDKW